MNASLTALIDRLNAAVEEKTPERITRRVKQDLEELLGNGALTLSEHYRTPRPDCYARRLLYQDPGDRFTAVVMTWGPGQGTPVHDHGGLWCVEGVVEGQMQVTQFDVRANGDAFDVTPVGAPINAGVGSAGRLIPPTDYHVLANAQRDATSITLHVYGGNLTGCRIFTPDANGRYTESVRALSYHD
jgi:predicted metal-dependent enzyme (double-stranded beta helix superfamily)